MPPADRSILITGCSSGIGRTVAEGLKQRGYQVFATARNPADVEQLMQSGFEALSLDLDDSASINSAVEEVLRRTGNHLFGVFHNGGYGQIGALEDISRAALRQQFETNLFGWHELSAKIIPVMRRQGYGRIVVNSSLLGFAALPYRGAYNATKFALEGWADTLRLELRDTGITVSIIQPGPIATRFRANALAAFRRNIDTAGSVHRETYAAIEARLTRPGPVSPFTLGPEAVLPAMIRILEGRHPRHRIGVTTPTRVLAVLKRVLPVSAMDWLLNAVGRRDLRRSQP